MSSNRFAVTPQPPYYVVTFVSQRLGDDDGYGDMAVRMAANSRRNKPDILASKAPGMRKVLA